MQDPDPGFRPEYGIATLLEPGVHRIVARNTSPMTFRGTNTYLIGHRGIAVIDPGPMDQDHLRAILDAVPAGGQISHIFVTHAHLDHSPLARPLSEVTGAPVLAFGDANAGRSAVMAQLAASGLMGGGEGVDAGFVPDTCLSDGELVTGDGWALEVLHTPGHFGNHIALAWRGALFCGDLVMGWATSLVSPPDGDLTDFMTSCTRLRKRAWRAFHPGHGAPIEDPAARLDWLIAHRKAREAAILEALSAQPATPRDLTKRIYTDIAPGLLPMAERNVLAHLVDLYGKSLVAPRGDLTATAVFERL